VNELETAADKTTHATPSRLSLAPVISTTRSPAGAYSGRRLEKLEALQTKIVSREEGAHETVPSLRRRKGKRFLSTGNFSSSFFWIASASNGPDLEFLCPDWNSSAVLEFLCIP
jgi:hypothetical protein